MLASFWSEVWRVMTSEPLTFLVGSLVGYGLRGRFRIIKVKREEEDK